MRVISGIAKGTPLKTIDGTMTRPTTDKVKEAIFSAIQFDLQDKTVLDLFAGSGQMAIEALSRGALRADIVEKNKNAARVIDFNLKKTKLSDKASVYNLDYLAALSALKERKFDIVFLDPPYKYGLEVMAVNRLEELDMLSDEAIVVIETAKETTLPESFKTIKLKKEYIYGTVKVRIYCKS